MLDLKFVRENPDKVKAGLAKRSQKLDIDPIAALDSQRRQILTEVEALKRQRNIASEEIGKLVQEKQDISGRRQVLKELSNKIKELDAQVAPIDEQLRQLLLRIPNIPHETVPVGDPTHNRVEKSWGEPASLPFPAKTHIELSEYLDIIDFGRAAKISGANFVLFKGMGARLERALINFMLDVHTAEHGYREVSPPFIVNRASMTGTGQLPKMEEDMYRTDADDFFLIPTAEVPVTNIHRDEVFAAGQLPVRYVAYSPCFRREAGSYGKDTRGLLRVHQFDKVEMVKFVMPETSYEELEKLLANAETILRRLGLPYRVLCLASGDLSFAAAKCYDIEVWAGGVGKWLEVSSCSNFEDFQARRAGIRFKDAGGRSGYVHTLNGSGLALARIVVAILENYQQADGTVRVPEALRPYMGGCELITASR